MGFYLEPIIVEVDQDEQPARIIWRRKVYRVQEVLELWFYAGEWWLTPMLRGYFRKYYRVQAAIVGQAPLSMEIYRERNRWHLSKVLD